jgi:hypothetical protein
MTFEKWLEENYMTAGGAPLVARAAWDAAVSMCKEVIESCRSLTPAVDGPVSEEELRKYQQTVEEVVNVAQARIDRPEVEKLIESLPRSKTLCPGDPQ